MLSNLVLVIVVLLVTEVPLAVIYSRHEHDALETSLQRDADSLAGLAEEIIEHPADHDVDNFAARFRAGAGSDLVIVDRAGRQLTAAGAIDADPATQAALRDAQSGTTRSGEASGHEFVAVPIGTVGDRHGAVLVGRPAGPVDQRVHQLWLALAAVAAGVLLLSVLVSRRAARWAIDPLQQLDEHAARLGRGELQARADATAGPPEVVELATTFNEMADQLDELVTSQRRFVADASHQLRTPLTALRLRLENLDANDPSAVAATRDAALLETSRLTRLVDGLLALARAERRREERQAVDVGEIVEERRAAWTPLAAEHDITLRVTGDDGATVTAMVVPGHLEQILDNLIDNAVDVTPPGGTVQLAFSIVGPLVEIHVADEGPGMSADERRRAFDPFWQGSNRQANGSAGLGLAIVEQLARGSGGSIALHPSESGGIDATVRVPAG